MSRRYYWVALLYFRVDQTLMLFGNLFVENALREILKVGFLHQFLKLAYFFVECLVMG